MRRKDREIIDPKRIDEIIENCDCCRIALADDKVPYIVPLSFGYERVNNKSYFYFHCAREGHKIDLLKKNHNVGFELDTAHALGKAEIACKYTYMFQSVIGQGAISMVNDKQEKISGLQKVMKHYSHKSDWQFDDKILDMMLVLRLEVNEMSCKEH